jgi:transposase-like protein
MTEKRQTWQGYIIRILQHFATKLRNIILLHVSVEVELIYSDRHN